MLLNTIEPQGCDDITGFVTFLINGLWQIRLSVIQPQAVTSLPSDEWPFTCRQDAGIKTPTLCIKTWTVFIQSLIQCLYLKHEKFRRSVSFKHIYLDQSQQKHPEHLPANQNLFYWQRSTAHVEIKRIGLYWKCFVLWWQTGEVESSKSWETFAESLQMWLQELKSPLGLALNPSARCEDLPLISQTGPSSCGWCRPAGPSARLGPSPGLPSAGGKSGPERGGARRTSSPYLRCPPPPEPPPGRAEPDSPLTMMSKWRGGQEQRDLHPTGGRTLPPGGGAAVGGGAGGAWRELRWVDSERSGGGRQRAAPRPTSTPSASCQKISAPTESFVPANQPVDRSLVINQWSMFPHILTSCLFARWRHADLIFIWLILASLCYWWLIKRRELQPYFCLFYQTGSAGSFELELRRHVFHQHQKLN